MSTEQVKPARLRVIIGEAVQNPALWKAYEKSNRTIIGSALPDSHKVQRFVRNSGLRPEDFYSEADYIRANRMDKFVAVILALAALIVIVVPWL